MPTASGAAGQRRGSSSPKSPLAPHWRWRRVFPGHQQELSGLRRWLSSLLPECPARDDVLSIVTELATNAIQHTASGRDGGWFAVEVTWHESVVQVAVADGGGPAEPRVVDEPDGERGRGLLLVHGLSVRTGFTGDQRGRLVWAQIAWPGLNPGATGTSRDPYQAAIREGEAALARRFTGVPAWFGRSTLAWWAVAGPAGLVSAPTAGELAWLLCRLLDAADPAQDPAARQACDSSAGEQRASQPHRKLGTGDRDAASWKRPGTASTSLGGRWHRRPARTRRLAVPRLMALGAA
jgi:Histidine kinase-like ATPase domain